MPDQAISPSPATLIPRSGRPAHQPAVAPTHDAVVLHATDTVATALRTLDAGTEARVATPDGIVALEVREPIPLCHKLALRPMATGETVLKYGAPIGRMREPVGAGGLVHVHNLESLRGPRR